MHEDFTDEAAMTRESADLFARIARRYDLMNRILSLGSDMRWRRVLADRLAGSCPLRVLDAAAGTGDQMLLLCRQTGAARVTGIDVSMEMLAIARQKLAAAGVRGKTSLVAGDVHCLPFDDGSFDAVTVSFGVRNFSDRARALGEIRRVLAPGGRLLVLELTVPEHPLVRPLYRVYSRLIIPLSGRMLAGDYAAYRYLNRSIEAFPPPDAFGEMLTAAGFRDIAIRPLTLGAATIFEGAV